MKWKDLFRDQREEVASNQLLLGTLWWAEGGPRNNEHVNEYDSNKPINVKLLLKTSGFQRLMTNDKLIPTIVDSDVLVIIF